MANLKRHNLGNLTDFTETPQLVQIANRSYYLVKKDEKYNLFERTCPHMGGIVTQQVDAFVCPLHSWKFGLDTGHGINNPRELTTYPVELDGQQLVVDLPAMQHTTLAKNMRVRDDLSIHLHRHASLELQWDEFSLLMDPWLIGNAFFGSWIHYPPYKLDISQIQPNAIVITHEHSDHFHRESLALFPKNIPIYVPDFPNQRLSKQLREMEFETIITMKFGERYKIYKDAYLTAYEPASLWNDALLLVEVEDFSLLNVNDAGINHRIAEAVSPVDVIAIQFSPGASGFPMTWENLDDTQKKSIMMNSCKGKFQQIRDATSLYQSSYVLPFASHFQLWHDTQQPFFPLMERVYVPDLVQAFEDGNNINLVDILPNETWHPATNTVNQFWRNREKIFEPDVIKRHMLSREHSAEFHTYHPTDLKIDLDQITAYLYAFNNIPEIQFCEDTRVLLKACSGTDYDKIIASIDFVINNGNLDILQARVVDKETGDMQTRDNAINVEIIIPASLLMAIVKHQYSWDEAIIGYWCRFWRKDDFYRANLWRLLQAPYYLKSHDSQPSTISRTTIDTLIDETWVIADIQARFGDSAERIMRRYGLYCVGCYRGNSETLLTGAQKHGLPDRLRHRLVQELQYTCQPHLSKHLVIDDKNDA